jgi:hypothetical protein
MELVLALDPGRTTGYAVATGDTECVIAYDEKPLDHKRFLELLQLYQPRYIVCEDFDYRRLTNVDLYPVELIGILKLYANIAFSHFDLYMQKPSVQGKQAYWTDAKIKELGLYLPYHHGRSALKHLLYWLQFGAGSQFKSLDKSPELVNIEWFVSHYIMF